MLHLSRGLTLKLQLFNRSNEDYSLTPHGRELLSRVKDAVLEAAIAGVGLCVLPVFIGSTDTRLQKCSGTLKTIEHTQ